MVWRAGFPDNHHSNMSGNNSVLINKPDEPCVDKESNQLTLCQGLRKTLSDIIDVKYLAYT